MGCGQGKSRFVPVLQIAGGNGEVRASGGNGAFPRKSSVTSEASGEFVARWLPPGA